MWYDPVNLTVHARVTRIPHFDLFVKQIFPDDFRAFWLELSGKI
jgi:hypothetical protein